MEPREIEPLTSYLQNGSGGSSEDIDRQGRLF